MNQNQEVSFAEMFAESTANLSVKTNKIIDAVVLNVDRHFVTVDAGLPIEAIIPTKEFLSIPEVGGTIKAIVFALDDGAGRVAISHHRAIEIESKKLIEDAIGEKSIIQAKVAEVLRAGLKIYIGVVEGFLPNSLIDTIRIDKATLVGKEISIVPLSIDDKNKNVVASRKEALIIERGGRLEPMEGELLVGDIREGIIKNIVKFGAFVDLGGRDVLAHVSDMGWDISNVNPFEDFEIGQRVKGLINKSDGNGKFCISLRQSNMAPWEAAKNDLPIGTKAKCKIHKITEDRSLVVIVNGVSGIIPAAEVSWVQKRGRELYQSYPTGAEVEAVVTGFIDDIGVEAVQLSIKKGQVNPWNEAAKTIKEGSIMNVSVKSVSEHNIIVSITDDITALVPFREISWGNPSAAINDIHAGDEISVKILSIDPESFRVIASIRDTKENISTSFSKGKKVDCKITGFSHNGEAVFVDISNDGEGTVKGLASARHALPEKTDKMKANDYYMVGDSVAGTVLDINKDLVQISLKTPKKKQEEAKTRVEATTTNRVIPNNAMFEAMSKARSA